MPEHSPHPPAAGGGPGRAPAAGTPFARLVPYRAAQQRPRLRLLCFPHGGGGASTFRHWQALFGTDIEVWAVQLPGREGRRAEAPHRSITAAVEELITGLGPRLDEPYALFGHSVGADLAYALALHLRRRGMRGPEHLVVAAQVPPHDRVIEDPLHLLGDAELLARLEQYGGIPDELLAQRAALMLALPRLRADLELSETFTVTADHRLDVPITALGGLHDRTLHGPDIERWGELTTDRFHVEWWPGDHFFVVSEVDEVVAHLLATLVPVVAPPTTPSPPLPGRAEATPARNAPVRAAEVAQEVTAVTRDVAAAMAEVAPLLAIELDDNFFDAGLGSVALVRLQTALQERGYDLELTDLFRWPTVRRLAAALGQPAPP